MAPPTADEILAKANQPASVTTDAGSATNRSADDYLKLLAAAAEKAAADAGKPAMRLFKLVPPGSV